MVVRSGFGLGIGNNDRFKKNSSAIYGDETGIGLWSPALGMIRHASLTLWWICRCDIAHRGCLLMLCYGLILLTQWLSNDAAAN